MDASRQRLLDLLSELLDAARQAGSETDDTQRLVALMTRLCSYTTGSAAHLLRRFDYPDKAEVLVEGVRQIQQRAGGVRFLPQEGEGANAAQKRLTRDLAEIHGQACKLRDFLYQLIDLVGAETAQTDPDGPLDGNRFRFAGKVHPMRPVVWKLLNALWGHEDRNMHDVEDEVWEVAGGSQLSDAKHDLKAFLKGIGYPSFVSKVRRSDSLIWKPF